MSWNTIPADRQAFIETILTPRQLEVLKARTNGHTWNTIATALNLDEATVRGHHKRALRKLANARKDHAA